MQFPDVTLKKTMGRSEMNPFRSTPIYAGFYPFRRGVNPCSYPYEPLIHQHLHKTMSMGMVTNRSEP
jgi:hypothetical protein